MQSSIHTVTTNKPTSNFHRPDALPVAQPTVSEHMLLRAIMHQNQINFETKNTYNTTLLDDANSAKQTCLLH